MPRGEAELTWLWAVLLLASTLPAPPNCQNDEVLHIEPDKAWCVPDSPVNPNLPELWRA